MSKVKRVSADQIPVIDISSLVLGEADIEVAKSLHHASQNLGFLYVTGHGMDPHLINQLYQSGLTFFRAPDEQKQSVSVSKNHRGWLGSGQAKMDDNALSDFKESYIWGAEDAHHFGDHSLRGSNRWPAFAPQLESLGNAYFNQAHQVAHHLMRGFALGLGLKEDFFLQTTQRPLSRASLVYYPNQEETNPNQFGVGPHTDFGTLTLLCQDHVGGLQVQDVNGEWLEAPPIEGSLVVNVGDLLTHWTAGAYKSTPHRVINSSGYERLSIVLAYDPNPETVIDPRSIMGADYSGDLHAMTCGDYLQRRFKKAFSYRD
jgi:isopenicillin N synthase-like dioxygenase